MMEWMHALTGLGIIPAVILKLTLLLAAGWVLHFTLRGRNPRWRVLLWRGMMLGAVLLPLLAWGGFFKVAVSLPEPPPAPEPVFEVPRIPMGRHAPDERFAFAPLPSPAAHESEVPGVPAPVPPAPCFSLAGWCADHAIALLWAAWGVGASLMGLRLLLGLLMLRRLLRRSLPAPGRLQLLLARIADGLGCTGEITLRLAEPLGSPLIAGLRRPVILLPERMAAPTYAGELPAVLAHELVHLRGADLGWMLGARILTAALWFHPLAWRVQAAHAGACEEVSDAVVADYLKDAAGYARALARVALDMAGHAAPALGIPMARGSEITRRLRALKGCIHASPLARRRVAVFLALGAVALLAVGGFKLVRAQHPQPPLATIPPAVPAPMETSSQPASNPPSISATAISGPGRMLHFPKDRSLGQLRITMRKLDDSIENRYLTDSSDVHREMGSGQYEFNHYQNIEARGDVFIPAGQLAALRINAIGGLDLAPLLRLNPDDIAWLSIYSGRSGFTPNMSPAEWDSNLDAGTAALPYLRHLTGLQGLELTGFRFSADALRQLKALPALRNLRLFSYQSPTDADLAGLEELKQVEVLRLEQGRFTDRGLASIAKMTGLQKLRLSTAHVQGPGLAALAALPNLHFIQVQGADFDDTKLAWLCRIPSLTGLDLYGPETNVTDAGLAEVAKLKNLEQLDLTHNRQITDAGLGHLRGLPKLRVLALGSGTEITDRGLQALASIKTLEYLALPGGAGITELGLGEVARLPNLKFCLGPFSTDERLEQLAQSNSLESLAVGGQTVTDRGLAALGRMKSLKSLTLWLSLEITNAGLASLAHLSNLERLDMTFNAPVHNRRQRCKVSLAGLNQLNTLGNLRVLRVDNALQDGATLNLPGLKQLEELRLNMENQNFLRAEDLAWLEETPNLFSLTLNTSHYMDETIVGGIADAGMAHLVKLKKLECLGLQAGPGLTDQGLAALADLGAMSFLAIDGTPRLTDAGLGHLAALKNLRDLNIRGDFTDSGLRRLEGMTNLRTVRIATRRPVSEQAVENLRAHISPFSMVEVRTAPTLAAASQSPVAATAVAVPAARAVSQSPAIAPSVVPAGTIPPGARVLHFPQDRSVGWIQTVDASARREIITTAYNINGMEENWAGLGEARGDVAVPAGKRVLLNIYDGEKDLSWLAGFQPDDLYAIAWRQINDAGIPFIAGLKGVKILDLRNFKLGRRPGPAGVSARGMQALAGMEGLEYFYLPDPITDEHLDTIVRIKSLKGLYFGVDTVSNAKLAELAQLTGLEELALQGNRMDDRWLAHLAALPHLQYLMLVGKMFTDSALAHVAKIRSLKILHLGHQPITDAGLAHLARATSLERLALFNTQVGDAGMAALAGLPSLKYLDVSNTQVGKPGMAQIARIKTLEELWLPCNTASDKELALLAELPRLKRLHIPVTYSRVGNNPIYYTDQGLARLCATLPGLETLDFGGAGITDQGMARVGQLTDLRELHIFGTPNVTNKGYGALANLKNLEILSMGDVRITAAGLNQLGSLPNLRELQLMVDREEDFRDAKLVLSGLTRLEKAVELPSLEDEDLACFAGMTQLQQFHVGHKAGITDAGLAHLARLTNLNSLDVGGPGVTDAGLAYLAGMKKLDFLRLSGNFSEAGLHSLEEFKALRTLFIQSTRNFSPAALERLRASLPALTYLTADPARAQTLWQRRERQTSASDSAGSASRGGGHPQTGSPAPDFTVKTLDGQAFKLSGQRGKVVLLNFWATWCRPCVASHPELVKLHDRLQKKFGDRVVMLDLALDDSDDMVRAYVQSDKLTWPQARIGQSSKIAAAYGVSGVPDAFLIGPDGKVVLNRESPETAQDTEAVIARLLGSGGGQADSTQSARVLHFPADRALGQLSIQDARLSDEIESFYIWIFPASQWQIYAPARGDVAIPPGKRVKLSISQEGARDLTPLKALPPDAFTAIYGGYLSDAQLPCLAHLTGLEELNLRAYTNGIPGGPAAITARGLKSLAGLANLKRLTTPELLDDAGLAEITRLKSLKSLDLAYNVVSNTGLAVLAELPALEALELGGKNISDDGLAIVRRLPKLRFLELWGVTFSDFGLEHLEGHPALRTLNLAGLPITDTGLAHVGKIPGLERLSLNDNQMITDEGMAALRPLRSLKWINLNQTRIGGRGLIHLGAIKSLEKIEPGMGEVDDEAIRALGGLKSLREFSFRKNTPQTAEIIAGMTQLTSLGFGGDYKHPFFDADLIPVSRLENLESFYLGGNGVTPQGVAMIARLPKLKNLNLSADFRKLGNAEIAEIRHAKGLKSLYIGHTGMTLDALNALNGLTELTELTVYDHREQLSYGKPLDISGMVNLEKAYLPVTRDEDLAGMANLKKLREFTMTWVAAYQTNRITERGLRHLAGLSGLNKLTIAGPGLNDGSLALLDGLPKLNTVSLCGNFTDRALQYFANRQGLQILSLISTQPITPTAQEALKRALPGLILKIEYDPALFNKKMPTVDTTSGRPDVGAPAPAIKVATFDNGEFKLEAQRGKVVLVNFWSAANRESIAMNPELKSLYEKLRGKHGARFEMLSLSVDPDPAMARAYVASDKLDWPQACIGAKSAIAKAYGVFEIPDAFLIGPDSKIALNRQSPESWQETEGVVARLLGTEGGKP